MVPETTTSAGVAGSRVAGTQCPYPLLDVRDANVNQRSSRLAGAACALFAATAARAEQVFQSGFEGPAPCIDVAAGDGTPFDVQSIVITPQFRLNGKQFPVDATRYANFYLANADGYQVLLGSTSMALLPSVRVVPGLYDIVYEYVTGPNIPLNHGARLSRNLWLGADRTLTIEVSSVKVNAEFRHNGVLFANDAGNAGNVFLDAIHYGGEAALGSTSQQQADFTILPGAYRLIYRHDAGNSVPFNDNARLGRHDLDVSGTHVFDVPSVVVNVTFRLNGGSFPNSAYERGDFSLEGTEAGTVELHDSTVTSVQRRIIPGQYGVHWQRVAGGGVVPINDDAIVAGPYDLTDTASVLADVQTVDVSGDYFVNGEAPPASAYESGETYAVDPNTGAKTILGRTHEQAYAARIVAQHYAVGYRIAAGGTILPSNPDTVLIADWDPVALPARDIDIPVGGFVATASFNGNPFPNSVYESASLFLQPLSGGPPTILGSTTLAQFDRRLLPGSYFVTYRLDAGTQLPRNLIAPVPGTRVISAASDTNDTIVVAGVGIERNVTLNGAAFPAGTNARLRWRARHPYGDDNAFWGDTSDGTLANQVIAGQYDVMYDHETGATLPQNSHQRLACWNVQPP